MMVKGIPGDGPPSPPRSNQGEPSCDLQEISINDSSLLYPISKPVYGTDSHLTNYQLSAYDSPDTMNEQPNGQIIPYQSSDYTPDMASSMDSRLQDVQDIPESVPYFPPYSIPEYHDPFGLAMAMNGYDTQMPAFDSHQSQGSSPMLSERQVQGHQNGAPPTPTSPGNGIELRRSTRVNRFLESSESPGPQRQHTVPPPRVIKKARRPHANKADKLKIPKLTAPLSKLTEGYQDIPVKDMKAYVNRSSEERREEAETKGKIPRPMNSFMLYRSAYAERTKHWGEQNNHQVVSSVTGQSWPLETVEIRNAYNEYAKIERANHQMAHPEYKFSPSKAQTSTKKRKQSDELESELSDLSETDDEWYSGSKKSKAKSRSRKRQAKAAPEVARDNRDQAADPMDRRNLSSYPATNHARPIPAAIEDAGSGHYYRTTIHNSLFDPNVQDVMIRKMEGPGAMYGEVPRYLGFPNGSPYEMLQQDSYEKLPIQEDSRLDPQLLAFDGPHRLHQMPHGMDLAQMDYDSAFNTPYTTIESDFGSDGDYLTAHQSQAYHQVPAYHPGMQVLTDNSDWHAELGHGGQLDQWTNDRPGQ